MVTFKQTLRRVKRKAWAMNETNSNHEVLPEIVRLERRTRRCAELSLADVMQILRQRAAKTVRGREEYTWRLR